MSEADDRSNEAHEQRYKHGKASRLWTAVAGEQPRRREVCEILAAWMEAYEVADAEAEQAFRDLAAREVGACEACKGTGRITIGFVTTSIASLASHPGSVRCEACKGAGRTAR